MESSAMPKENLIRLATLHKRMNVSLLIVFIGWLFTNAASSDKPETAVVLIGLGFLMYLVAGIPFLYNSIRLGMMLGGSYRFIPLIILAITAVPFLMDSWLPALLRAVIFFLIFGFFGASIVSLKAQNILKTAGMRVGFLGARQVSIRGRWKD